MNAPQRGKTSAASTPGSFAPHSRSESEATLGNGLSPQVNQALIDAETFARDGGDRDVPTISLLSDQGTAIPSATLCNACAEPTAVESLQAQNHGDDATATWGASTGNDAVGCVYCGRGVDSRAEERLADALARLEPGDIAGYTWNGENYTSEALRLKLVETGSIHFGRAMKQGHTVEELLDRHAGNLGVDREDEYSFDSDDFPKVILRSQLTTDDVDWLEAGL